MSADAWHPYHPPPSTGGWSRYTPPRPQRPHPTRVRVPKAPTRPVPRVAADPFAPTPDAQLRARGSAGLEALNAQGAAAQAYGAQMPGIAGLTGLQSGRQLQAQLNQELGTQLSSVGANAASNQSSIYQHLLDQELQKAIASQSGL